MSESNPQAYFDSDYYLSVNAARDAVFRLVLPGLIDRLALHSAIDVGCGTGYYAAYLTTLGLQVTGLDGRIENVELARKRCPTATFAIGDIEQLADDAFKPFDLVFCAGLLYHLENPFRAVRRLRALCQSVCVIESRVYWTDLPAALLVQEVDNPTQALARYAWVPSRRSMISLLYAAGFTHVYSVQYSSKHEELKPGIWRTPRRHFWVASLRPINLPLLQLAACVPADEIHSASMYSRNLRRFMRAIFDAFGWLNF